ncbi:MAG: response regulator [Cyanobacteria bacterium P01_G01_bin.67]
MSSSNVAVNNSLSTISPTEKLRLLVVDDHQLVCKHICLTLAPEPDMQVVGIANNGNTALELAQHLQPNIALVDADMPEMNGIELTQKLSQLLPDTKVIVLSPHKGQEYADSAFDAGAKGYIHKHPQAVELELADAIRFVDSHYLQLGRSLFPALPEQSSALAQNTVAEAPENSQLDPVHQTSELTTVKAIEQQDGWSVPTQELLNALPKVWTRGLAYVLILFAGILIPWASMSRVDETGTARGRLEPKGQTIPLDAPVLGKITSVLVQEGDTVTTGQTLAELESDLIANQLDELKEKQSGQEKKLTQLELLKNQLTLSLGTQERQNQAQQLEKQSQVEQARQSFQGLNSLYLTQKEEKLARIEQFEQAVDASQANVRLATVALDGAKNKAARYHQAFKDGIIPEDRYQETEQVASENTERLAQANSELAQARSRLKEEESNYRNFLKQTESEIAQAELRFQEQENGSQGLIQSGKLAISKTEEQLKNLESDMATLKSEIAQAKSQIASLKFKLTQQVITAPADGVVFHLPVAGAGAVVQPGERIVDIAPKDSALILKAQMPPSESGSLEVGMPVKVKFDAFPFQDYGIVGGRVNWISPDSKFVDLEQGRQEVFELVIELDRTYIEDREKRIVLTPGQTATAEVIVQERRIIDLILDPFKKLQKGGLEL